MKTLYKYTALLLRVFWPIWIIAAVVAIYVVFAPRSARGQDNRMYSFDERQARALEEIADTLKEMKKCGCK
jgi:hypothetical protein